MYQKLLYDITEVCKMVGTTSRTLRFYEEKVLSKAPRLELHHAVNILRSNYLL